ncbi:MAG: hypothetical protein FJX57_00340 [Alphaproteobacteria bacterium]|nr:hypothetical protein [Alphaproteobacteria bacterium]
MRFVVAVAALFALSGCVVATDGVEVGVGVSSGYHHPPRHGYWHHPPPRYYRPTYHQPRHWGPRYWEPQPRPYRYRGW